LLITVVLEGRICPSGAKALAMNLLLAFAVPLTWLSCAGGILFAFIFCPNDQQNGFHAAKTQSGSWQR